MIRSSACQPWQPDLPGHAGDRGDLLSYTTPWDTIFPAQLEALLRAKGLEAHVINAGVVAATTAGMLRRIGSAAPPGTDLVILQPGGNDLRFFGTRACSG